MLSNKTNRIGLITLYRDNFGSILQAYASYSYIKNLGLRCDILQYKYKASLVEKLKKIPKVLYMSIRYKQYFKDKINAKRLYTKEQNLLSEGTRFLMDQFVNTTFSIHYSESLEELNQNYDLFVTGSDQIWNGYDAFKYLTFADRNKRIALAPSFGTSSIKDYLKNDIRKALIGFDWISVREETGAQIVKELTGKDAIRLPDPTLILDKKEWKQFAIGGMKKSNYILIHFLNKPNQCAIKTINSYIQINNVEAICICNKYEELSLIQNCKFMDINPKDYVSLINYADFVFTDSFHSTLFSLNLETQFLTFERQYLHGNSQSSRIIDLLKRVGMEDRYVVDNKVPYFEKMNSWDSDIVFAEERTKIRKYIEKALGV